MKLRIATLAAISALAAGPSLAQMGPGHHGPGGPPSILPMADELGLTAEQKAQVQAIESRYRDGELGDAMEAMRTSQKTLAETIHDLKATDAAVTEAATAAAAVETRVAVLRHHFVVDIATVLTEEQKAKLAEKHHGRGPGEGHGH